MIENGRVIHSVHREDFPEAEWRENDHWEWGWVGTEDGLAAAVLTAIKVERHGEDPPLWARVQIVRSRVSGFGSEVIAHAEHELCNRAEGLITLYRSGTATPEGKVACAHLPLDPEIDRRLKAYPRKFHNWKKAGEVGPCPRHPTPIYSREEAIETGDRKLATAAALLGFGVKPRQKSD